MTALAEAQFEGRLGPVERLEALLDAGARPAEAAPGLWAVQGRVRGLEGLGVAISPGTRIDSPWCERFRGLAQEAAAASGRLLVFWDSAAVAAEAALAWGACLETLARTPLVVGLVGGPLAAPLALGAHAGSRAATILVEGQGSLSLTGPAARKRALGLAADETGFTPALATRASDDLAAARLARALLAALEDGRVASADPPDRCCEALEVDARRESGPGIAAGGFVMADVLRAIADEGDVLHLGDRGSTVLTALARLGGCRVAVLGSEPAVRSGALDAEGACRAVEFLGLVGGRLPILLLIDSPGLGPCRPGEAEAELARHLRALSAKLAALAGEMPLVRLVTRRAYGLAASMLLAPSTEGAVTLAWRGAFFGTSRHPIPAEALRPKLDALVEPGKTREILTGILARTARPPS